LEALNGKPRRLAAITSNLVRREDVSKRLAMVHL
jgi:hypothetical protein